MTDGILEVVNATGERCEPRTLVGRGGTEGPTCAHWSSPACESRGGTAATTLAACKVLDSAFSCSSGCEASDDLRLRLYVRGASEERWGRRVNLG